MGLLSNTDKEISEKAIVWDSQQHLKFDVPLEDMKPTIYLGRTVVRPSCGWCQHRTVV